MPEPYFMVIGRVIINFMPTTCPRGDCPGDRATWCGHEERRAQAVREWLARHREHAQRRAIATVLAQMDRNRAAIAASGEWDMAEAAQGTKRAITWRQTLRVPHHTTGGDL